LTLKINRFPLLLLNLFVCLSSTSELKASECHGEHHASYFPHAKKAVTNTIKYCEWHADQGSDYGQCLDFFGIRRGTSLAMVQDDRICLTEVVPAAFAQKVCQQGNQGDRQRKCFFYWTSP